jgi:hypothetical protein
MGYVNGRCLPSIGRLRMGVAARGTMTALILAKRSDHSFGGRTMSGSHTLVAQRRRVFAAALLYLLTAQIDAPAQSRWTVDSKASLAWWQMSPNLNHLWATTCPEEPSWRPGEGRSAGWSVAQFGASRIRDAASADTVNVPLYPRWEARALCTEAVRGYITVVDPVRWRGIRGEVVVRADALITGNDDRDAYTRIAILQTNRYPEIRFTLDSVVNVTREADTLRGTAVGVFTVRGVARSIATPVKAWPETGGLRVLAKFRIDADSLVPVYGLSSYALGLGVGTKIWQFLFPGVDLLLHLE